MDHRLPEGFIPRLPHDRSAVPVRHELGRSQAVIEIEIKIPGGDIHHGHADLTHVEVFGGGARGGFGDQLPVLIVDVIGRDSAHRLLDPLPQSVIGVSGNGVFTFLHLPESVVLVVDEGSISVSRGITVGIVPEIYLRRRVAEGDLIQPVLSCGIVVIGLDHAVHIPGQSIARTVIRVADFTVGPGRGLQPGQGVVSECLIIPRRIGGRNARQVPVAVIGIGALHHGAGIGHLNAPAGGPGLVVHHPAR